MGLGAMPVFSSFHSAKMDRPQQLSIPALLYGERTEKHIEVVTKTAQQAQAVKILKGA